MDQLDNKMTEKEILDFGIIKLIIPKDSIIELLPHPESYGYKMAVFSNEIFTDIYEDDLGNYYSKTNDLELLNYIMILQEVYAQK